MLLLSLELPFSQAFLLLGECFGRTEEWQNVEECELSTFVVVVCVCVVCCFCCCLLCENLLRLVSASQVSLSLSFPLLSIYLLSSVTIS